MRPAFLFIADSDPRQIKRRDEIFIRGGAIHNRLIELISLVEVVAALYLTVTSVRKAFVFDPGDPREDRNAIAEKKQDGARRERR